MNDTENPAPAGEPERVPDEAQVDPQKQVPARVPMRAGAHPMAIVPRTYEEAWRISTHYIATKLAARDVNTAERVQLVIMAGLEVGLPPVAALNNIAIINNKPRIWGAAVPALAINTGQLAGWEESVTGEGDAMVARCKVSRRINPDVVVTKEVTFSVEDAKRAGLWETEPRVERWVWRTDGQKGKEKKVVDNDSPWYRYPKRMMQMRTRQVITDLFADAFCGLGVAEVYVGPGADAEMRDVTPQVEMDDVVVNPLGGDDEPMVNIKVVAPDGSPIEGEAQDAPAEPAQEPEPEKAPKQRASRKAAPAKPVEAPQADPEPDAPAPAKKAPAPAHPDTLKDPPANASQRWAFDHYFTHVRQWVGLAVEASGQIDGFLPETYIKDRWEREKTLRNRLGVVLTAEQKTEALTFCREAVNKIKAA